MRIAGVVDIVLRRQCRKGQKAAPGANKCEQQPGGSQRILLRCRQRKAKRHQRIEQEIERDIQKPSRIREPSPARQRTVQTIQQAVQDDGDQCCRVPAEGQKWQRQQADGKPRQGKSVGRNARLIQRRDQTIQRGFYPWMQVTVKHQASL